MTIQDNPEDYFVDMIHSASGEWTARICQPINNGNQTLVIEAKSFVDTDSGRKKAVKQANFWADLYQVEGIGEIGVVKVKLT